MKPTKNVTIPSICDKIEEIPCIKCKATLKEIEVKLMQCLSLMIYYNY